MKKKGSIREKEAIAIKWAPDVLRPYLNGSKLVVEKDHQSLEWLMSAKQPARLVRWAVALSEFDFVIEYRQRRLNRNADALSRLTSEETSVNASCRLEALFSIHTVTEHLFEMALQRISEWIQIYFTLRGSLH